MSCIKTALQFLIIASFLIAAGLQAAPAGPNGLVVIVSDYGNQDYYVGAAKGAIYTKFQGARIDTITNEVPPFNIREGSYLLAHAAIEYPSGTVFCAMVDPGMGIKHRFIAVETEDGKMFVAPDNGILTLVLRQSKIKEAREITNPLFMRDGGVSASTFYGRDVYGPAAATLAKGDSIALAGPIAKDLVTYRIAEPRQDGNVLVGEVEHVDWFGNVVTNIPASLVEKFGVAYGRIVRVDVGPEALDAPLVKSYADASQGSWLVVVGSSGMLEIARNQASANAFLQAHAGTSVRVRL